MSPELWPAKLLVDLGDIQLKKDEGVKQHERAEDFLVHAKLKVQGQIIDNILCKIFLPERITDKPFLKFKPTADQYAQLTTSHEGSFEAELIGFDKKVEVSLDAPNVYFSGMVTKYWGPDFSESSLNGEPQNFHVIRHLTSNENPRKTSLTIWISQNPMLGPAMSKMSHYDGNIEYKRFRQLEFSLSSEINIKFDRHFKDKIIGENESKQWSYLVACTDIDIPAREVIALQNKIFEKLDALLIVASLASRTRTAWVGWQACDHQVTTEYYRGNFTFPTGKSEPSFDQGLVEAKDFYDFLAVSYPAFINHPNKEAVQNAIMSVVPGRKKVLEESFLSMFAGLEALILDFRRRENLEFAVPEPGEWEVIKRIIKDNISKTLKTDTTKNQRLYIYNKLEELNRIPLQVAFKKFCEFYDFDVSDLWPLFKTNNIIGLSDIRNKLTHGDHFSREFHDALWVAEENIRFMLERALVKILDWPIDKTEVSREFLANQSVALKDMPAEQSRISKYFSTNDLQ